jgi:hypothetical protein
MMKQRIRLAVVTFLLLVGSAGGGLGAGERLTMVVTPSKSMAPATIRVRVGVEPAADNRVLNVIADSGAYYRSSEIQLDGERARACSWSSSQPPRRQPHGAGHAPG